MAMSLIRLMTHIDLLKVSKWSCEYKGDHWQVEDVDMDFKLKVVEFRCKIKRDAEEHDLVLVEHYEGGGDTLRLDRAEYDADHIVAVKFRLFPPTTKIKLKTEFDADDKPGFEEVIRLATKLKMSIF